MRKVIFVTEGDASTSSGSGSGTPYSIVRAFRDAGVEVATVDSELYGLFKVLVAIRCWSPSRSRWRARYRLSTLAFEMRSKRAQQKVSALLKADPSAVVVQYGAGCMPVSDERVRLFLYCDNFVKHTLANNFSNAAQLTDQECRASIANESRVYDRANHIFTMSAYIARMFSEFGIVPATKLAPVYAGFPVIERHVASDPRGDDVTRILFVGRDWISKGGASLFRAFLKKRLEFPGIRIAILGPVEQPRETVGVEGVEFLGYLDKSDAAQQAALIRVYSSSSIFALPTEYDSFPISVLEAMSYGLPVILTNTGALPEMVQDGETGLLVPPRDDVALENALGRLLASPVAARAMGEEGSRRARSVFNWNTVAAKMLAEMWK